jgi:hypothetical protein
MTRKQEDRLEKLEIKTADILDKTVQKSLMNTNAKLNEASKFLQTEARRFAEKANKNISKFDVAMYTFCFIIGVFLMLLVQRMFFTNFADHYFNQAVDARVEQRLQQQKE